MLAGLGMARALITLAFAVGMALIGVRVIFCLLQANRATPMVGFITQTTDPLIRPFESVFNIQHVDPAGAHGALDLAALIALVAYGLILALIIAILRVPGRGRRVVTP